MNRFVAFFVLALWMAQSQAGDFEIKSVAPLSVTYRGVALIVGEDVVPEFTDSPNISPVAVAGWDSAFHVWRADKASRTRIEVATGADAFEFTFVRLVEADVTGFVRYSFVVPHEFLDGCQAEIVGTGVKTPAEYVQRRHIAGPMGADAISCVKPITYLRVHHPAGDLDFDLNPRGWWTGEKTVTPHAAEWTMRRDEKGYVFSTAFSRTQYGTIQEFKFVIRRTADTRPVYEVHPRAAVRWTSPYRNILQLNMGDVSVEGYENVSATTEAKARWRNPANIRWERDERFADSGQTRCEGATPINPKEESVLEIDLERDGYYLVNLLVGAPDRQVGPCEIESGGGRKASCPAVSAGAYDSWAVVGVAEKGAMALRFRGDFRLAAVGITPFMYDNEDFLFKRSWWLSPERHRDDTLPD